MIPRLPQGFSHPMLIGEGAFSSVYRVRQEALERWVALKFIYERVPEKRRELLKEAQTQAKLRADCVPHMYDAFEWRSSVCMVMECISGIPLTTVLELPLAPDDRLAIAGEFIAALAAIHGLGFAHRDLKPDNIIVAPDRGLFLVDFGFSKKIADANVSSVAHAKGTPAFMAPELWRHGAPADLMRADMYSAGKILRIILRSTAALEFTDALINDDPLERPASGPGLRHQWESSPWNRPERLDWQRIAGTLSAQRLSDDLLNASKQLLHAGRVDEAYWLLVESIEKNGDNHRAIELMAGFQQTTRRRPSRVRLAVLAAAVAGGLLTAYIAGKRSSQPAVPETFQPRRQQPAMLTAAGETPFAVGRIALREDSLRFDRLSGMLVIRPKARAPVVRVDGRFVDRDSVCGSGLRLHWGEHDVAVSDGSGRTYRRESVSLLPFQTKVINLSVRDTAPKGH